MAIPSTQDLLTTFRVIETVKEAVQRFEDGEINVFDAVQRIRDAAVEHHAGIVPLNVPEPKRRAG